LCAKTIWLLLVWARFNHFITRFSSIYSK